MPNTQCQGTACLGTAGGKDEPASPHSSLSDVRAADSNERVKAPAARVVWGWGLRGGAPAALVAGRRCLSTRRGQAAALEQARPLQLLWPALTSSAPQQCGCCRRTTSATCSTALSQHSSLLAPTLPGSEALGTSSSPVRACRVQRCAEPQRWLFRAGREPSSSSPAAGTPPAHSTPLSSALFLQRHFHIRTRGETEVGESRRNASSQVSSEFLFSLGLLGAPLRCWPCAPTLWQFPAGRL